MLTPSDFGLVEGELPLAIPTSAPIERIALDNRYKGLQIAININTLVRNWLNSIEYRGKILPKQIGDFIIQEMELITLIMAEHLAKPLFYASDVGPLYNRLALAPHLRKRKEIDTLCPFITKYIMMTHNVRTRPKEEWYLDHGVRFNSRGQYAIVLSHNNMDYLQSNIDVLESHTGKFKYHHELHDKFSPMRDGTGNLVNLERLPFIEELVLIMGTKSLFKIKKPAMRSALLEVAARHKWNAKMSRLKLQGGLSDPQIRPYYESLPKLH